MTHAECAELLDPALRRLFGHATINLALELDKLLGIQEYHDYFYVLKNSDNKPMSDELRQLFIQLAGPHGKTFLKAYRIKKGLEHADVPTT